jgi:adhesin/invasin
MKAYRFLLSAVLISLAGCSSVGQGWDSTVDYVFGPDDGGNQRQEKASEILADAATSASPEEAIVDKIVEDSTSKLSRSAANSIDSAIANSKTDISVIGIKSKKTRYFISNVKGFEPSDDGHSQTFMQSSIGNANSRAVINLGLGRRYLSGDEGMITGFNAFLDYDPKYGHQRASVGAELKTSAFELTANSYMALSKWSSGKNSNQERPLDGHDIELGGQIPYMPGAKLYLKNWNWKGVEGVADTKGITYSVVFSHLVDNVHIELGRRDYDGLTKDENFGKLTYSISMGDGPSRSDKPIFSSEMFEGSSMRGKMLDKVRRNNAIVIQTKFSTSVGGV